MTARHRTMAGHRAGRSGNPFRTSQTRPGTLPFLFPDDEQLDSLVRRFLDEGRRGQIVGPHGSGKSTLMIDLVKQLRSRGWEVCHQRIDSQRGWRRSARQQVRRVPAGSIVAIDGFDQLPWRSRVVLWMLVAWRRLGLLVTTHRIHRRLPVLRTTLMNERIARQVIEAYLERSATGIAAGERSGLLAELPDRLQHHQGNLREVLFDLYERCAT